VIPYGPVEDEDTVFAMAMIAGRVALLRGDVAAVERLSNRDGLALEATYLDGGSVRLLVDGRPVLTLPAYQMRNARARIIATRDRLRRERLTAAIDSRN
jgi:hypothetical protein